MILVTILPKKGSARVASCSSSCANGKGPQLALRAKGETMTDYCQCFPLPLPGFVGSGVVVVFTVVTVSFTMSTVPSAKNLPWIVTF